MTVKVKALSVLALAAVTTAAVVGRQYYNQSKTTLAGLQLERNIEALADGEVFIFTPCYAPLPHGSEDDFGLFYVCNDKTTVTEIYPCDKQKYLFYKGAHGACSE